MRNKKSSIAVVYLAGGRKWIGWKHFSDFLRHTKIGIPNRTMSSMSYTRALARMPIWRQLCAGFQVSTRMPSRWGMIDSILGPTWLQSTRSPRITFAFSTPIPNCWGLLG